MEEYFDLNFTKNKLNEYLEFGRENELCIRIDNNDYMIIPLKNKISFQWIGNTEELYFNSVEELFKSLLVNNIVLDRDWNKVEKIWYY